MNEAPFSWNTRYRHPGGWVCQLTVRAETGQDLFDKVDAGLAWLTEKGCTPAEASSAPSASANGNGDAKMCPVHNVPMKHHSNGSGSWWSHKAPDGSWCKGK